MGVVATDFDHVQALMNAYEAHGQGHVFKFFDQLSESEQSLFIGQLVKVPIDNLGDFFVQATKDKPASDIIPVSRTDVVRLGDCPCDELRWWNIGMEAIANGRVAVVTLAGGQGTRLGSSLPKGCFDIGLPSHKSLFQLQAERLMRLGTLAGAPITWYIMTSGPTHESTVQFFGKNAFFGLDQSRVKFFQQGVLPGMSVDGKILLQTKGSLALSPDGNGGIYTALRQNGIIEDLERNGVEYVHMHSVDNCLVRMADPVFVGLCTERSADCASKSVPKTDPTESVGILSLRRSDRKMVVAEYSELDPTLTAAVNDDGELMFNTANIAIHMFSTTFLRDICYNPDFRMPYHVAKKKIPSIDMATGESLATPPVGIKLEAFIFDALELARNPVILQVARASEFAPLKNATGSAAVDTPEHCCERLYTLHRQWLCNAKAVVGGEGPCEISPLLSYSGEGLEHLAGRTLQLPLCPGDTQSAKL